MIKIITLMVAMMITMPVEIEAKEKRTCWKYSNKKSCNKACGHGDGKNKYNYYECYWSGPPDTGSCYTSENKSYNEC